MHYESACEEMKPKYKCEISNGSKRGEVYSVCELRVVHEPGSDSMQYVVSKFWIDKIYWEDGTIEEQVIREEPQTGFVGHSLESLRNNISKKIDELKKVRYACYPDRTIMKRIPAHLIKFKEDKEDE